MSKPPVSSAAPGEGDSDSETESEESEEEGNELKVVQDLAKRLRSGRRRGKLKVDEGWDRIIKRSNEHLLLFSMVGLASSILLSYYKWYVRCRVDANGVCTPGATGAITTATVHDIPGGFANLTYVLLVFGQLVISFSTCVCIYLLTQLYRLHLVERRRQWSGYDEIDLINDDGDRKEKILTFKSSYKFMRSSLRWQYLLEVLVHLFHPVIWVESDTNSGLQTIYEVSESFIFLRLYLLIRVLYINSNIYKHREEIVKNNRELQIAGFQVSMTSTAKIVFYQYPTLVMLAMVVGAVCVFGFWIFVTERNNNPSFEELETCLWFVFVSLATIGYGDVYPITTTGRLIVMVIVFASLFINTVFAGIVTNLVSPSREQRLVTSYLAKHSSTDVYRKAAVRLLVLAVKFRMDGGSLSIGSRRPPQLYSAMKRFQQARMALRDSLGSANDPVMDGKLVNAVVDAWALNRALDDQAAEIEQVEEALTKTVKKLKEMIKDHGVNKSAAAGKHSTSQSPAAKRSASGRRR